MNTTESDSSSKDIETNNHSFQEQEKIAEDSFKSALNFNPQVDGDSDEEESVD